METTIQLARDWDGAAYSPSRQKSIYPFEAASFLSACCPGERVIVAWSVLNSSGVDAFLQIREGGSSGKILLSHSLPAGTTTIYQFPLKSDGAAWICISSTPIEFTPVSDLSGFGGTFYTR